MNPKHFLPKYKYVMFQSKQSCTKLNYFLTAATSSGLLLPNMECQTWTATEKTSCHVVVMVSHHYVQQCSWAHHIALLRSHQIVNIVCEYAKVYFRKIYSNSNAPYWKVGILISVNTLREQGYFRYSNRTRQLQWKYTAVKATSNHLSPEEA